MQCGLKHVLVPLALAHFNAIMVMQSTVTGSTFTLHQVCSALIVRLYSLYKRCFQQDNVTSDALTMHVKVGCTLPGLCPTIINILWLVALLRMIRNRLHTAQTVTVMDMSTHKNSMQ